MKGRVYAPLLGRFLRADPFVQAPTNSQSPNRYSYVFNNPLSFTDPTGYLISWGGGLFGGIFGTGPAMLGAMFPSRLGSSLAQFDYWMHTDQGLGPQLVQTGMRVVACTYGTAVGCAAASGAMTYWLTDGDLSQGIKAAAIAYASASIAEGIGDAVENGIIDHSQAAWLHGFSQGGLGVIGAGKFTWRNFGSSFASGYVGHAMGRFENPGVDIFLAGSLGGVTSRIAGGSFSDGFITAAMVKIFNRHAHEDPYASDCSPGDSGCEHVYTAPDGRQVYRTQGASQALVLENLVGGFVRGVVGFGRAIGNGVKTGFAGLRTFLFGPACFTANTLVRTREGLVPIKDIKVGDLVASKSDITGEVDWKPVARTFVYQDKQVLNIQLINQTGIEKSIQATPEHPFYVNGIGWVQAKDLSINDRIGTIHEKSSRVVSIANDANLHTVYNFEVESFHTYFVSELDLWVHNSGIKIMNPNKILLSHEA